MAQLNLPENKGQTGQSKSISDTLKWQKIYRISPLKNFDFSNLNEVESQLNKIHSTYPKLLQQAVITTSLVEKSITMFTSAVVAGSLFPDSWFNYNNTRNSPALYILIIYPASAGKGSAAMSRKLLSKINDHIIEEYRKLFDVYKEKLRLYRKKPTGVPPEKPKLKLVLAPGNTSSAKFIEMLSDINGEEILTMVETEMDVIGISSNSEFGSMNSSIFRQAFHHEPISKMIKKDGELQIVNNPKLSLILSGTMNQVSKILHSNADGLFSRFLVLSGDAELIWKNTQPCDECPVLDDQFDLLAQECFDIWKKYKPQKVEVKFTQEQWDAIQEFGKHHLMNVHHFTGESAASLPKRHALMICRLATIYTMFRHHEQDSKDTVIYCSDEDFGNAMWMIEYSLTCGLKLFKSLPGEKDEALIVNTKMQFMLALPIEFESKDAEALKAKFNISERTISRWLSEFVKAGFLDRIKPGYFRKTGMATMAVATVDE